MSGFTYVMSDLHGEYAMFLQMLSEISFSDEDTLIILGDCCDRGDNGIAILKDIMGRENVKCVMGNHDLMFLENFPLLMGEIPENINTMLNSNLSDREYENLQLWFLNGGRHTIQELAKFKPEERLKIRDFVDSFENYIELSVGDKDYTLVHAGLFGFSPDKPMSEYPVEHLAWYRLEYSHTYLKNRHLITGHTITNRIRCNPNPGRIFKGYGNIAIDCGACFNGGRLACFRLDDWKEFYIEHSDDIGEVT